MNIELEKVLQKDRDLLYDLVQIYLDELNVYISIPYNNKTNKYEYEIDKYLDDDFAYFIKLKEEIIGFVLLEKSENNVYEISEIFIKNKYKSKGYGSIVAKKVFDLYKGNWMIKVVPNSKKAENFWLNVIKEYTNDNYKVEHTGKYNRAEFYFKNL